MHLNRPAQQCYLLFSKTETLASRSLLTPLPPVWKPPGSLHHLLFPLTALPTQIPLLTHHILPKAALPPSHPPEQDSTLPSELSSHKSFTVPIYGVDIISIIQRVLGRLNEIAHEKYPRWAALHRKWELSASALSFECSNHKLPCKDLCTCFAFPTRF